MRTGQSLAHPPAWSRASTKVPLLLGGAGTLFSVGMIAATMSSVAGTRCWACGGRLAQPPAALPLATAPSRSAPGEGARPARCTRHATAVSASPGPGWTAPRALRARRSSAGLAAVRSPGRLQGSTWERLLLDRCPARVGKGKHLRTHRGVQNPPGSALGGQAGWTLPWRGPRPRSCSGSRPSCPWPSRLSAGLSPAAPRLSRCSRDHPCPILLANSARPACACELMATACGLALSAGRWHRTSLVRGRPSTLLLDHRQSC